MTPVFRAFFVFLSLLFALPAHGSEYPLESVFFVTEAEVVQLKKIPAETTHQAGAALGGPAQRSAMKTKTGMDEKRAEELAALFDLMRIKGVGPKMAILLHGAGVSCVVHMGREDAEELLKRVLETNQRLGVTSKMPDVPLLKNWILQARKLKPQFRGSS
jgi:hypothetical protein